jgi:hypothetical protein
MARELDHERRVAVVVVHGVGDTQPGSALNELVDSLEGRFGSEVEADKYSAVYSLRSQPVGDGDSEHKFPAHTRRAKVASAGEVRFYDLHWADLRRTQPGYISTLIAAFPIIFEVHHVIDAILPKDAGPLTRWLRFFLKVATWTLHWIVGISVCLVLIGFVIYAGYFRLPSLAGFLAKPGDPPNYEAAMFWGIAFLMLILFVAVLVTWLVLRYFRSSWLETYRIIARPVIVWPLFLLVFVWLLYMFPASQFLRGTAFLQDTDRPAQEVHVCAYIDRIYYISQSIRLGWCLLVVVALAIVVTLWSTRRSATEARAGAAMAATSIVVLQSALWLTLLSTFGIQIIREAGHYEIPPCSLKALYAPFVGTAGQLVLLGAVLFGTYTIRWISARNRLLPLEDRAEKMPRMLFGSAVTLAILVGALAQIGLFLSAFIEAFGDNNLLYQNTPGVVVDIGKFVAYWVSSPFLGFRSWFNPIVGFVAIGTSFLIAFNFGAIHITRDLIDYQYSSRRLIHGRLVSKKPRRERLSERINTLVRDVICKDPPFDDLIFVAHSQGSVMVYDFLLQESKECQELLRARPHLITFGSPLGHLYQFYFKEYAELSQGIAQLRPRLASWTNFYRVDDYVGRSIEEGEGFVRNIVMPAGGHMDYWREPQLSEVLLERIRTPGGGAQPASQTAPAIAG